MATETLTDTATDLSPNECLILFANRGMTVTLADDDADVLTRHAEELARSADAVLAAAEIMLAKDHSQFGPETEAAIAGARVLSQLSGIASRLAFAKLTHVER